MVVVYSVPQEMVIRMSLRAALVFWDEGCLVYSYLVFKSIRGRDGYQ